MTAADERLIVLWTSGDKEAAVKMVFMYAFNAKRNQWWKEVTLIVWGPSAKLLSQDRELQEYLEKMKGEGVVIEACVTCADMYGVADTLRGMGIDVKSMGPPLTDYLKAGYKLLSV